MRQLDSQPRMGILRRIGPRSRRRKSRLRRLLFAGGQSLERHRLRHSGRRGLRRYRAQYRQQRPDVVRRLGRQRPHDDGHGRTRLRQQRRRTRPPDQRSRPHVRRRRQYRQRSDGHTRRRHLRVQHQPRQFGQPRNLQRMYQPRRPHDKGRTCFRHRRRQPTATRT